MPIMTILSEIMNYWENVNELPSFIRRTVQAGMILTPLGLLYLIMPFRKEVAGHYMNFVEFWASGAGISSILFVVLGLIGSWGIAARKPNTRWALVCQGPSLFSSGRAKVIFQFSDHGVSFLSVLLILKWTFRPFEFGCFES